MRLELIGLVIYAALPAVWAGGSASYSLDPIAVDGGGATGTSSHYELNASSNVGGTGVSSNYGLRSGFAGQLADPVALAVEAVPTTLAEETSRQLSASLVFDDATTHSLSPSVVTWAVDGGPLSGISLTGLASASAVYENSSAVARGSYLSVSGTVGLTILEVDPDNFGTYAGDEIDDDWQVGFFGVDHPDGAAGADPDEDNDSNYREFLAGFDPTDQEGFLDVSVSDGGGGTVAVELNRAIPGRIYRLLESADLDGGWTEVLNFTVSSTEEPKLVQDSDPPQERNFYRIEISKP